MSLCAIHNFLQPCVECKESEQQKERAENLERELTNTRRQLADEADMRGQAWIDKGISALQDKLESAQNELANIIHDMERMQDSLSKEATARIAAEDQLAAMKKAQSDAAEGLPPEENGEDAESFTNNYGPSGYVVSIDAYDILRQSAIAQAAQIAALKEDSEWSFRMDDAPTDGTLLLLMLKADDDRVHPLQDTDGYSLTIGHNNHSNDGMSEWEFAGWCWEHDHYTQGKGTPIAWMIAPIAQDTARAAQVKQ